jgi:acetoacetyl-CoA reductase
MTRVAVVTGGTRGIGEAVSIALRDIGYRVAASYVGDVERARAFTEHTGIDSLQWNVADYDACHEAVDQITALLGSVDVLINNAGITRDCSVLKMSRYDWSDVVDTNLTGGFNMVKAVLPAMRERGWGRIVNIGSINGQAGQFGQVNYSATKAAIHGFTKSLAQECARFGVTVNTVAPGYINTDMVAAVPPEQLAKIVAKVPVGRLGEAHEIARVVAFLCAQESGFITGSTVSINGGQHMY